VVHLNGGFSYGVVVPDMLARRRAGPSLPLTSVRLLELFDRFYDLEAEDAVWLRGIAVAVRPLVDSGAGANANVLGLDASGTMLASSVSLGHDIQEMWTSFRRAVPPETLWETDLAGPITNAARTPSPSQLYAREGHAAMGVYSYTSINASPVPRMRVSIGIPNPVGCCEFWPDRDRSTWERVAAHLGAAYRLRIRRALREPPAMVVDAAGRLLHAEPHVSTGPARERLLAALSAVGRARRTTMPHEAMLTAWHALHEGCWSIVESVEHDGRRLLIARTNAPFPPLAPAHLPARSAAFAATLTTAERRVVTALGQGHSNKRIAGDLGIAISTVATLLTRAKGKLGCASRVELAQVGRLLQSADHP
jgi:DNA-binding CsgD family transcriptional regulator